VIPLDAKNHWFRYHHLFQQQLQNQLQRHRNPEEIANLHSRASEWFEAEGLVDEAIHHALAAEDVDRAAEIVERHARPMMNEDKWYVLGNWLARLPDAVVQERPELLLAR
jgi:LuxR family maltose regulon positive regulatory protein